MRTIGISIIIDNIFGYDVVPQSAEIPSDLFVPIQNFFRTHDRGVRVQAKVGDVLSKEDLLNLTASAIWKRVCPKDGFEMCDRWSSDFAGHCYFLILQTLEERCELHADNREFAFPFKIEPLAYFFKFRVKESMATNVDPPPVPRQPHHKFDLHHLYLLAKG